MESPYFVNNSRPDGLVNAQDGAPWFSLWSTGSYLLAAVSAYRLDVITRDEFDERISQALFALGELPLTPDGLPAAYYRGDKQEILGKPESSAIGVGRLLMALQVLLWHYPQHAPAVKALLSHWHLDALFVQAKNTNAALAVRHWVIPTDEPRDSFGYRTYASHTLRFINTTGGLAVTQPPEGQSMIDIDGIMVPDEGLRTPWGKQPSLVSLPWLLTGLELGFDAQSGEVAWRIMQIQQRRHSLRVRKPPISTDYAEQAPDFATAIPERQPQRAPGETAYDKAAPERTAITSTRSAFAWYALFRNGWSEALRQQVQPLLVPGKGWQRGLNLNNSVNNVIDADTNAVVLESLAYIAGGQLLCLGCQHTPSTATASAGVTP